MVFSCFFRRTHRSVSSSSSSDRSSSSDSDSERNLKRKKIRSSSNERETVPKKIVRGLAAKQEDAEVVKEPIKTEPIKEEAPAPPTRLRRKLPSTSDVSEKVSLRRTM